MKSHPLFLILLPLCVFLWIAASPDGLGRHSAEEYKFGIGYPIHWKVEQRELGKGSLKVGEVSFLHKNIKPATKWTFFKVVATERDSTSSPFKGIVDIVGEKGSYREASLGKDPIRILVDEGKTTWLLCDKNFDDFSYSFSFRIQGKLDTDSWIGIKMVLGTFGRL